MAVANVAPRVWQTLAARFSEMVPGAAFARFLDVGCGTGQSRQVYAERARSFNRQERGCGIEVVARHLLDDLRLIDRQAGRLDVRGVPPASEQERELVQDRGLGGRPGEGEDRADLDLLGGNGPPTIASNWTQDVPARYGMRHPGLTHSWVYPQIDTAPRR